MSEQHVRRWGEGFALHLRTDLRQRQLKAHVPVGRDPPSILSLRAYTSFALPLPLLCPKPSQCCSALPRDATS